MTARIRRITAAERLAYKRALAKTPGAKWRFQTGDTFAVETRGDKRIGSRFDEVVVDDWLHAEMMHTRSVFVQVGGLVLWLNLTKDGARVTGAEIRAEGEEKKALLAAMREVLK